ncbi:Myb-like_DNA-binding domain-containing protein [Hexamita inflata]|uniref:Myb-like DNA-binding domain-containing protein n=1 Tax=Hexamita inflata TaxID=28002 RepID=A0AA86NTI1_9EUKA|nr:Myb-like DNA-binding domain-containing protein [Hexamita inflata]
MTYHKWTKEEERRLSDGVKYYGINWEAIQRYCFPQFNATSLKNKYYAVVHHILVKRQAEGSQEVKNCSDIASKSESLVASASKNVWATTSEEDVLMRIRMIIEGQM